MHGEVNVNLHVARCLITLPLVLHRSARSFRRTVSLEQPDGWVTAGGPRLCWPRQTRNMAERCIRY